LLDFASSGYLKMLRRYLWPSSGHRRSTHTNYLTELLKSVPAFHPAKKRNHNMPPLPVNTSAAVPLPRGLRRCAPAEEEARIIRAARAGSTSFFDRHRSISLDQCEPPLQCQDRARGRAHYRTLASGVNTPCGSGDAPLARPQRMGRRASGGRERAACPAAPGPAQTIDTRAKRRFPT
jgi:hypothetical protein